MRYSLFLLACLAVSFGAADDATLEPTKDLEGGNDQDALGGFLGEESEALDSTEAAAEEEETEPVELPEDFEFRGEVPEDEVPEPIEEEEELDEVVEEETPVAEIAEDETPVAEIAEDEELDEAGEVVEDEDILDEIEDELETEIKEEELDEAGKDELPVDEKEKEAEDEVPEIDEEEDLVSKDEEDEITDPPKKEVEEAPTPVAVDIDEDFSFGSFTDFPTAEPVPRFTPYPTALKKPSLRPAAQYVTTDDDPLKNDPFDNAKGDDFDEWGFNQETVEEVEKEVEEMAHDTKVVIALSVVFGAMFFFAIFVAYQMLENPNGCCASICRITVACVCGIIRCICYPCRAMCGCTGESSRQQDHMMLANDGHFTHDLELS